MSTYPERSVYGGAMAAAKGGESRGTFPYYREGFGRSEELSDRVVGPHAGQSSCSSSSSLPVKVCLEEPPASWFVYQGRASHPRLGRNIPMQIELRWTGRRATGKWFIFRETVDVAADRTSDWPFIVRTRSGVSATLWGQETASNRLAGEFWYSGEGGGTFELLQCPNVFVSPECAPWGAPAQATQEHRPRLDPATAVDQTLKEPTKLIFTTEAQLAQAMVHVLKMYPNGLDMAKLKQTIHKNTGLWLSEAFLGYRKLRDLIKSPTISNVCWTERMGSCNRVIARPAAAPSQYDGSHKDPALEARQSLTSSPMGSPDPIALAYDGGQDLNSASL